MPPPIDGESPPPPPPFGILELSADWKCYACDDPLLKPWQELTGRYKIKGGEETQYRITFAVGGVRSDGTQTYRLTPLNGTQTVKTDAAGYYNGKFTFNSGYENSPGALPYLIHGETERVLVGMHDMSENCVSGKDIIVTITDAPIPPGY